MSSEPPVNEDPTESPPKLFTGFRDRLDRIRRGPLGTFVWLLLGTSLIVSAILFVGMACKSMR